MRGRLALVGSGEYLPVMHEIEAWLLEDRPRVYVQLATAASTEGEHTIKHWHELGAVAAQRLDARQVVVDVRTRADADEQRWVDAIEGAGLIYLSGGKPTHLADTLRGTRVWAAIESAWQSGASLAGCSAGAMVMGGYVPDFRHPKSGGAEGLGIVSAARVMPHFDRLGGWLPNLALRPLTAPDAVVLGIDEDTALVADAQNGTTWTWRPMGRQSTYVIGRDDRTRINDEIMLEVRAQA